MTAEVSAVPDVLGPDVRVVFCGINPGRASAAAGAAFANPRNDFWRLLHAAGFTPRVLAPEEQHELLSYGVGLTNAARRTTRGSGDLRRVDFAGAAGRLEEIARSFHPRAIGFVGKTAYTGTFGERCEHGLSCRLGDPWLPVEDTTYCRLADADLRRNLCQSSGHERKPTTELRKFLQLPWYA